MNKCKILLKVIIAIFIVFTILSFNIFVNADTSEETPVNDPIPPKGEFYKTSEGWMPQNSQNHYGKVPLYVRGEIHRTVKLPEERWKLQPSGNKWTATIDGNTVFCSWFNRGLKYSRYDEKTYYLTPGAKITLASGGGGTVGSGRTIGSWMNELKSKWEDEMRRLIDDEKIWQYEDPGESDAEEEANKGTATHLDSDDYPDSDFSVTWGSITWDSVEGVSTNPATTNMGCIVHKADGSSNPSNISSTGTMLYYQASGITEQYTSKTWAEKQGETQALEALNTVFHSEDSDFTGTITYATKDGLATVDVQPYIAKVGPEHGGDRAVPEYYPTPEDEWVDDDNNKYDDERERGWKRTRIDEYKNDWYSFIFSSSENAYGTPTYGTRYTLDDIQWAYWRLLNTPECTSAAADSKEPILRPHTVSSENNRDAGENLYQRAIEYKEFVDTYAASYASKVSIKDDEAQVIVNRTDKKYILGPYSLDYKSIPDISYVKGLQIEYSGGVLEFSEQKNEIDLILDGTGIKGSNGMLKSYPASGQKFFIVLDANSIGLDTTKVSLKAIFEYIDESYARFEKFESEIHHYRYYGYGLISTEAHTAADAGDGYVEGACSSDHKQRHGTVTLTIKFIQGASPTNGTHVIGKDDDGNDVYCQIYKNEELTATFTYDVYAPYIRMGEDIWKKFTAQELTNVGKRIGGDDGGAGEVGGSDNAYRNYKTVEKKVDINLAMELGGYVWVDAELGGKETMGDNLCDIKVTQKDKADKKDPTEFDTNFDGSKDKRVADVKVILYRTLNKTNAVQKKVMYTSDGVNTANMPVTKDGKIVKLTLGEYRFIELAPMYEYYIAFEYNGQYYEPVTYTSPADEDNGWGRLQEDENKSDEQIENSPTGMWEYNSNATDLRKKTDGAGSREAYNEMFGTINSYSKNYRKDGTDRPTFTRMELLGYTLKENGKYEPTPTYASDDTAHEYPLPVSGKAVIDRFGNLLPELEDYTGTDKKGKMVTFVKDCRMTAYTKDSTNSQMDFYPYARYTPEVFVIDNRINNYLSVIGTRFPKVEENLDYPEGPIYDSAYFINLGLHKRPDVDIAVNVDLEKVTMEINNHVHEYTYDAINVCSCKSCGWSGKFSELELKVKSGNPSPRYALCCPSCGSEKISTFLGIEARLADLTYYNRDYTREVYKSDYGYKVSDYITPATYGRDKSDELEIFVTYRVDVTNSSMSIKTRIDELVDYYDETYIPVPERSYIEISQGPNSGKYPIVFSDEDDKTSKCKSPDMSGNMMYIRGIGKDDGENGFYLTAGQTACFYVTFRVDKFSKDGEEWVKLGEKDNLVELNGYSTRYEKHTIIPNDYDEHTGKPNGTTDDTVTAGLIDFNSTPGNQDVNEAYEKWIIENDTDKAPTLNLKLNDDDDDNRVISGFVWEDARNHEVKNSSQNYYATTGDGKVGSDEEKINGVTVQLVEQLENGTEFVWREFGNGGTGVPFGNVQTVDGNGTTVGGSGNPTLPLAETPIIRRNLPLNESGEYATQVENYQFTDTNVKGAYAFKSFIPGNYIVRFIYGDTVKTVLPSSLTVDGISVNGQNTNSYNGQDYKSTSYQVNVNQKENVSETETKNITYKWRLMPVKATRTMNADGTYSYTEIVGDAGSIKNWVYVYKIHDASGNVVYYPVFNDIGERQEAPILTEISTFKDDASNNETLKLYGEDGKLLRDTVSTTEYNLSATPNPINNAKLPVTAQNGYLYAITESELYNGNPDSAYPNVSDAKDIYRDGKRPTDAADAYGMRNNKDLNSREDVIDYSDYDDEDKGIVNHIAEVLASSRADYPVVNANANTDYNDDYEENRKALLNELMKNTQMTAETGLIVVEFEYDSTSSDVKDISDVLSAVLTGVDNATIDKIARAVLKEGGYERATYQTYLNTFEANATLDNIVEKTGFTRARALKVMNTINGDNYKIQNVNLGLEERPKSQLLLNKKIVNVKVTLANGSILFDANSVAANVLWRDHIEYEAEFPKTFGTPQYKRNMLVKINEQRENETTNIGYIQLTMDEEIMHGATIKFDYELKVTNAGEIDYDDLQFYYNSAKDNVNIDAGTVVKTKANKVIDYVSNNLQFSTSDNGEYWKAIPIKASGADTEGVFNNDTDTKDTKNYVNASLADEIKQYNTIIISDKLSNLLTPEHYVENITTPEVHISETAIPLTLTQLITSENDTDDLTYRNIAEIVETSNEVGRRMNQSVVGNQDPTKKIPNEVDTDTAQLVRILPPFGDTSMYLVVSIIAIVSLGIVVVGIIFIKKKVIK